MGTIFIAGAVKLGKEGYGKSDNCCALHRSWHRRRVLRQGTHCQRQTFAGSIEPLAPGAKLVTSLGGEVHQLCLGLFR